MPQPILRGSRETPATDAPTARRPESATTRQHPLLALQRAAGNQAVSGLLSAGPAAVQRWPLPAGTVPTDTTQPQPGADATAEPFTDAQLERMGQAAQVNVLFSNIESLKNDRINTWRETADKKEPKPMRQALDVVVAMVALGMGGVFGLAITKGMQGEFFKDFVYLAGLELVDKVAEDSYHYAMQSAGESLQGGIQSAMGKRGPNIDAAMAGDKDDLIATYTEAMRLQNRAETAEQQSQFNLNASTTYKKSALLLKGIALKLIYDNLFSQPQAFQRELTEGFIRLMDEGYVAAEAKDYGGDKAKAWQQDSDLHETDERKGNLLVLPEKVSFSLGPYHNVNLGFGNYYALATGANTKTLMKLKGTAVKDLPLSLGFRYWVEDPFYRIFKGGMVKAWFTRDPSGNIYLDDLGDSAMEWLASYHSGLTRELSDSEREKWAPLGAKKLYEATKDRPINKLENSDIL